MHFLDPGNALHLVVEAGTEQPLSQHIVGDLIDNFGKGGGGGGGGGAPAADDATGGGLLCFMLNHLITKLKNKYSEKREGAAKAPEPEAEESEKSSSKAGPGLFGGGDTSSDESSEDD